MTCKMGHWCHLLEVVRSRALWRSSMVPALGRPTHSDLREAGASLVHREEGEKRQRAKETPFAESGVPGIAGTVDSVV